MPYAVIEDGVVTNIIVLNEENAAEFPNAVKLPDKPVDIGDSYIDGEFLNVAELLLVQLDAANETIAELDAAVVDLIYQNIQLELGV